MADEASGFDRDDEERDPGRADGTDPADDRTDLTDPTTEWNPSSRPVSSEHNGRDGRNRDENGWASEPDADGTSDDRARFGTNDDADRIRLDLSSDDPGSSPTTDSQAESDPRAPEPSSTPVEAGDPTLENVLFVVLGAVATILVIVRFVSLPL